MSIFIYILAILLPFGFLYVRLPSPRPQSESRPDDIKVVKAKITLNKERELDLLDLRSSVIDRIYELFGWGISFQLVSKNKADPGDKSRGKVGKPAHLQGWIRKITSIIAGDKQYSATFYLKDEDGIPGAIKVINNHRYEFALRTVTLDMGEEQIHFVCNSWIQPGEENSRIFFANDPYLPSNTPDLLREFRKEELKNLRGEGRDKDYIGRVYDYDYYNDLGNEKNKRPTLGGSPDRPYPRRGKYLPRDEYFRHNKTSDFYADLGKSLIKGKILKLTGGNEFHSFQDVRKLYGKAWLANLFSWIVEHLIPLEFIRELLKTDGEPFFKFPIPLVIKNDDGNDYWATDKEFARQMLAGINPACLRAAKEKEIHDYVSTTPEKIKLSNLRAGDGKEIEKRYFMLDFSFMKDFLDTIYQHTKQRVYASKTLLYQNDDGTLIPEAIWLTEKNRTGGESTKMYTPHGKTSASETALWEWRLAKAFVTVVDSGYHQLVSHWLYTHAAVEPFVIATNRQMSVMHPVYKLLNPHFRDTMSINNKARGVLINAGGIIESNFFTGSYSMELTSEIYKTWNLMDHALPTDLIKRGVAVRRGNEIELLIEDYPYAVDALAVWSEIEKWVASYCSIYYPDEHAIQSDAELQAWWKDIREVGHGDLKDRTWWPDMQNKQDLINVCSIIIWLASAFHAAVNFGQYAYAGFVLNRPTVIRRLMPETGSEEAALRINPEGYFLKAITSRSQAIDILEILQILSRHSKEEIYVGNPGEENWTSDQQAKNALIGFQRGLAGVQDGISDRNKNEKLKNRNGDVKVPYNLLYPETPSGDTPVITPSDLHVNPGGRPPFIPKKKSDYGDGRIGLEGKGIPNSVSI